MLLRSPMLPAPLIYGSSRLPRALQGSASKVGSHAGPKRPKAAQRISSSIRAADDGNATSASASATVVAAPPALPSLPPDGVGTTALDASALPALDAAVSLPVDPSSSGLVGAAAAAPRSSSAPSSDAPSPLPRAAASPPSAASPPFSLFEIPPAVGGMLAINLGAALFGSNMVAVKLAQAGGASPAALSAGRFALAAALFVPSAVAALKKEKSEEEERRRKRGSEGSSSSSSSPSSPSSSSSSDFLLSRSGLELGLYLFGGYTGQAVGLSMTTASRGAFASAFTVLAVPMLQAAAAALGGGGGAGKERPPPVPASTWVAAAAAVAGVFLLTSDGGGGSSGSLSAAAAATAAGPNVGDFLCVASAVLFGVHKWRSEQLVERLSSSSAGAGAGGGTREVGGGAAEATAKGRESSDESSSSGSSSSGSGGSSNEETVRSLVALQLCVLALASIALCVPEVAGAVRGALADQSAIFDLGSPSTSSSSSVELYGAVASQLWSQFSGLPWPLFAYMGLFTTAWTIEAEAKALRHVSASTAALIYSSEPLWGAAFAALFLGERLQGVGGWVGAALVVGSSLVAQVGGAAGKKGGGKGAAREEK